MNVRLCFLICKLRIIVLNLQGRYENWKIMYILVIFLEQSITIYNSAHASFLPSCNLNVTVMRGKLKKNSFDGKSMFQFIS